MGVVLSSEQQACVDYRGGPLAVLAGPGTGKTTLIVHRIAGLIEQGVDPSQIVALTYTNKAARHLREQVAKVLSAHHGTQRGLDLAERVFAGTYHSFGQRLVHRFASRLGMPRQLTLIDSPQYKATARQLMVGNPLWDEFVGPGVKAAADRALSIINAFEDLGIDPSEAKAFCDRWQTQIELIDDQSVRRSQTHECNEIRATAELFAAIQKHMRPKGWVTFNQLISIPAEFLKQDRIARELVQGQFRHAVVDEWQDINPATIKLLAEVFPPATNAGSKQPDLVVVGDDDQAIYGFRGADQFAFERFTKLWPVHERKRLTINRRSSQSIVETAKAIIERAPKRFDSNKHITASGQVAGGPVRVVHTQDSDQWSHVIAADILSLLVKERDLKPQNIAVLVRSRSQTHEVALALRSAGIPFVMMQENDVTQDLGVRDLLAWIDVLINPNSGMIAGPLLQRPPVNLSSAEHLELLRAYGQAVTTHAVLSGPKPAPFPAFAAEHMPNHAGLAWFSKLYAKYSALAAAKSAKELIYGLAVDADVVHADLLPAHEREERLRAVTVFLRFVGTRQDRLSKPGRIDQFAEYFEDLDASERQELKLKEDLLDETQTVQQEEDLKGDSEGGGVSIITAHASKGLEFEVVYIGKVENRGFASGKSDPPVLPQAFRDVVAPITDTNPKDTSDLARDVDSGAYDASKESSDSSKSSAKSETEAEERRLFYVACTRAIRELIIVGKPIKKPGVAQNFLSDLAAIGKTSSSQVTSNAESVLNTAESHARQAFAKLKSAAIAQASGRLERASIIKSQQRMIIASAITQLSAAQDELQFVRVQQQLLEAAASIAAVDHLLAERIVPTWVEAQPGISSFLHKAQTAIDPPITQSAAEFSADRVRLHAPTGPLRLSYSQIDSYLRCPSCYYLKFIAKVPQDDRTETAAGTIIHESLAKFYESWIDAESNGRNLPSTDRLLAIAKEQLVAASPETFDEGLYQTMRAQLKNAHEVLHMPTASTTTFYERPETPFRLPIECDGMTHELTGSIDRVERLIDNSFRIVDYKSGKDWKSLLQPDAQDALQLCIYVLALRHKLQVPESEKLAGVAEYWLLATGRKGVLSFADVNPQETLATIQEVIRGILAGNFAPKRTKSGELKCTSPLCKLFVPGSGA